MNEFDKQHFLTNIQVNGKSLLKVMGLYIQNWLNKIIFVSVLNSNVVHTTFCAQPRCPSCMVTSNIHQPITVQYDHTWLTTVKSGPLQNSFHLNLSLMKSILKQIVVKQAKILHHIIVIYTGHPWRWYVYSCRGCDSHCDIYHPYL